MRAVYGTAEAVPLRGCCGRPMAFGPTRTAMSLARGGLGLTSGVGNRRYRPNEEGNSVFAPAGFTPACGSKVGVFDAGCYGTETQG
jgi:hypothetical protein